MIWDPQLQAIITLAAVATAWYSLLAVLLYRPAGRSSLEQADYGVVLAAVWMALPILATNPVLGRFLPTTDAQTYAAQGESLAYLVYLQLAISTALLFGDRGWFNDFTIGVPLTVVGLLPMLAALFFLLRIIGRRRWVHLVEHGRIAGWRLMDVTIPRPAGIPVLTGDGTGPVKVLVRVFYTTHPFRTTNAEPPALVALSRNRGSNAAAAA